MKFSFLPKLFSELEDPRYFQILYLGSFLLYGISYLGWEGHIQKFAYIFSVGIVTQIIGATLTRKSLSSVKSALITCLGLSLLLQVNQAWIAGLGALLAIGSKFVIKRKNKHIFNPAAFGIVATAILTQQAWISPGQWGSSVIMLFFIGAAGLMMVLKVGRLDTSITFLLTFGMLLMIRQVFFLGWEIDVWAHKMINGALLLFTFFMITDPMTTPNHTRARIIWSMIIGVLLFVVSNYYYVQTAAIWILVLISPITPFFDHFFKAPKYEWKVNNKIKYESL